MSREDDEDTGNDGDSTSRKGTSTIGSSSKNTQSKSKSMQVSQKGKEELTQGHRQTLTSIPESDLLIEEEKDASNLFHQYKTSGGEIVTLYHTDKRVQQLHARKALDLSLQSEEVPDLSKEEFLKEQAKLMASFEKKASSAGRGKGR